MSAAPAPLAAVLHLAARAERRRAAAWAIATAVTAGGALAADPSVVAPVIAGVVGAALTLWSVRLAWGIDLARRDLARADTPPRRGYVALVHDPNPRAARPLLAIWPQAPAAGEPVPRAEGVWRCDDELVDLISMLGSVVVHEAWVDTGSRPRWVLADAGIALPHRRALLGRFYLGTLLRRQRLGPPVPLTAADPHAAPSAGEELPLRGGLPGSVLRRVLFLAVLTAIVMLLG